VATVRRIGSVLALLAVVVPCPLRASGAREGELAVLAAASLAEAMAEVAAAWRARGEPGLRLQLGGSNELARQIAAGAPGDLFVSADAAKMDGLERSGLLVPGTRRDLLGNRLVVIVPADAPPLAAPGVLTGPAVARLALAQPDAVPAGIYARTWLERRGLWERLRARVVATENVRGALAAVASGNADAGIVYATDAAVSTRVRVVFEVPAGEAPPVVYPAAVLAGSQRPAAARRLLDFLSGPAARAIFERRGFTVPPAP
jgi:molybdate transport system substrate-binding protein